MLGTWLKEKLSRRPSNRERQRILVGGLDLEGQHEFLNTLSKSKSEWNLSSAGVNVLPADFQYKKSKSLLLQFVFLDRGASAVYFAGSGFDSQMFHP